MRIPENLIVALRDSGAQNISAISNNAGIDDLVLVFFCKPVRSRKWCRLCCENATFEKQYLNGELELEFNPQGTLAERIRAGGAGIPGFYTKTGVGTLIADGKEHKDFDGETYIMKLVWWPMFRLSKPGRPTRKGNLIYRKTARNFNPMMADRGQDHSSGS